MHVEPSANGERAGNGRSAEYRKWCKPALPPRRSTRRNHSRLRFLREKHNFPAAGTLGQVRQAIQALVLRKHAFQQGIERVRLDMLSAI
jgi:hypothetical protein